MNFDDIKELQIGGKTVSELYINGKKAWSAVVSEGLCFTAEQANSTIALNKRGWPTGEFVYKTTSTDWQDYTFGTTMTLTNVGDKVWFKNKSNLYIADSSKYFYFTMSGKIAASDSIQWMFDNTGTSTTAKMCYRMFRGCTSLTQAPELPATQLANYCYQYMFNVCTSLTQAPELPATALADNCYQYMFDTCTSLTQASELPATQLANYCYYRMFYGCTSLTQAPELPATQLANNCYQFMFSGCNNLSSLSVDFTAFNPTNATTSWLNNVSNTGTFYCKSALGNNSTITRGASKCPTNWNVVNTDVTGF